MAHPIDNAVQAAFLTALCAELRESRRRQGLTQADLAARTGGMVTKAALANYETGHRSLRVEVFWALARALEESCGDLIARAERHANLRHDTGLPSAIVINLHRIVASTDPRLDGVKRWFELRYRSSRPRTERLDGVAIKALAALMGTEPDECRAVLLEAGGAVRADVLDDTTIDVGSTGESVHGLPDQYRGTGGTAPGFGVAAVTGMGRPVD